MRWFPYIILAYLALGVHVGVRPFVAIGGTVAPNLPLIAAVFVAINAPRDAALLGCFGIGLLQDLLTQQPPGLYAFSYGVVATMIASTQSAVYRNHPLTHLFMTAMAASVTGVILLLHSFLYPADGRLSLREHVLTIAYTAALAPILVGLLGRARRAFAFQPPRRGGMARG